MAIRLVVLTAYEGHPLEILRAVLGFNTGIHLRVLSFARYQAHLLRLISEGNGE